MASPPPPRRGGTLAGLLLEAAGQFADRPAVWAGPRMTTFAELADQARRFAGYLSAAGLRPGDRVMLEMGNSTAFIVAHYAVALLGGISVPVNPKLGATALAHCRTQAAARWQLTDQEPTTGAGAAGPAGIRVTEEADGELTLARRTADQPPVPLTKLAALQQLASVSPGDGAILFFTSGTTGLPKGILLTHAQALAGIDAWAERWSFHEQTVTLMAAPFFHVVYNPLVLGAHRRGGATVVQQDLSVRRVTAALQRSRATALMANPAFMAQLATPRSSRRHDLTSLDTIIYGAAPAPEPVVRSLAQLFPSAALYNCYGLTETSSALTCLDRHELTGRERSVGRPHPGIEVQIRDQDGQPLAAGEPGEVCARGPGVITGYHRNAALDAERFFGEWLRTGDMGYLDAEGYLYLLDRRDDLINVAGEKIYPCQVEEVLFRETDVLDAAAVGAPDLQRGQVVHAYVVLRPGTALDTEALRGLCRRQLPPFAVPRRVVVVDELPRNPTGKVLREKLGELA